MARNERGALPKILVVKGAHCCYDDPAIWTGRRREAGNRPMKEGERLTSPVSAAEEPIVFVIDDDPLMLGGLSSLFRSIGLRVEAFASATELLQHPELPRLGYQTAAVERFRSASRA